MNFKKIVTAALILSMNFIFICAHDITVHASKTDTGQEWQAEEAESFVVAFYEALMEKDYEKVREQMTEEEFLPYAIHSHALFASGLQKYDNIIVKAYSMKDQNNWMAVVRYEAFFEGIDIGIPGSVTVLVQRQEDGQWKILMDCPEDLYEEALQILEAEEVIQWFHEVNEKYNEIMSENPEMMDYFIVLSNSVDKAVLEAMENEDPESILREGNNTGTEDNDIYIVQPGDCLWRIAQSELGDGMYWTELYERNQDVIGDNPNLILAGMQLKIDLVHD